MGLWVLVICILATTSASQGQSMTGFISIDCGLEGDSNYTDSTTKIIYSPDALYIDTGENRRVSPETNLTGLFEYYKTLRSFSNGTRNCYTLQPLVKGRKYLVRAEFQYGNFDGRNSPPTFDVYLGIHFWWTVPPDDFSRLEIIVVSPGESMQVCLVNKGLGTPYITVLELRTLLDSIYPLVNTSQALVLRGDRRDHGINGSRRYPQDPYDRIWFGLWKSDWLPKSTNEKIEPGTRDFMVPGSILRTAVTTPNVSESLDFTVAGILGEKIYVFMYFAELQQLERNETREFNVYANNSLWFPQYRPKYLSADTVFTNSPGAGGTTTYSLKATGNSTLPPMINAFESHILVQLSALPTQENDTKAITKIRDFYKLKKHWVGDPCEPQNLTWEGLICSNDDSKYHRIVALNLSHAELGGEISPYISELSALVSLDLSNNNLTGEIPSDLIKLSQLQALNLSNNNLTGQVPPILEEKSQNKTFSLRTDGNTDLCTKVHPCETKETKETKKTKKVIVLIAVPVGAIFVILFVLVILLWRIRRGKKTIHDATPEDLQSRRPPENLHPESNQFTFAEIVDITKNFQNQVGKGGFGIVYHGYLRNGIEAAVKMLSKTSSQGPKEFKAEAQILTRVHHKNLVSLLGYCNDQNNLALVYEFMVQGSLRNHLSDHTINHLSWSNRIRIALEVAQGLDYLHSFCKPPIIHRDVKSTNILLNSNMEAKLADFGLSRLFHDDSAYVSTVVAGTPGYLDPEYYQTSKLNEKSDIYSFGIVMLELITGKSPIIDGLEKISIVSWVQSRIEKGDIFQIVDQKLQGKYDINSVWKYIEIALSCASHYSTQRPSMSDVVMRLKECQSSISSNEIPRNYEDPTQSSTAMFHDSLFHGTNPSVR